MRYWQCRGQVWVHLNLKGPQDFLNGCLSPPTNKQTEFSNKSKKSRACQRCTTNLSYNNWYRSLVWSVTNLISFNVPSEWIKFRTVWHLTLVGSKGENYCFLLKVKGGKLLALTPDFLQETQLRLLLWSLLLTWYWPRHMICQYSDKFLPHSLTDGLDRRPSLLSAPVNIFSGILWSGQCSPFIQRTCISHRASVRINNTSPPSSSSYRHNKKFQ